MVYTVEKKRALFIENQYSIHKTTYTIDITRKCGIKNNALYIHMYNMYMHVYMYMHITCMYLYNEPREEDSWNGVLSSAKCPRERVQYTTLMYM